MASNYFGYSDDSPVRYPRTDRIRFDASSEDDAPVTTPGDTYTRGPEDPSTSGGSGGGTTAPPTYAYKHRMGVLDWTKFNDLTHTSPKYTFLRAAAQYGWDTEAQRQALLSALRADSSGYFKNATLNGDKLILNSTDPVFGGAYGFDVFGGFSGENGEALPTSHATWQGFDANGNRLGATPQTTAASSPTDGLTTGWGQTDAIIKAFETLASQARMGTGTTGAQSTTATVGGARSGVSGGAGGSGIQRSTSGSGYTPTYTGTGTTGTSATTRATGTSGTGTTTTATGNTGSVWKSLGGLDSASAITSLYQYYYGRDPSAEELNAQIGGVNSNRNVLQQIEYNLNTDAKKRGLGPYGASASSGSNQIFDDPLGSEIENLVDQNVSRLTQDVSDPVREQYAKLLQEAIKYYSGDVFSKSENAAIRASAFDTLERDHQNARRTTLEQLAQRGIDPSSGVAVSALREVDAQYEALKGQQQQGLNTYALNANQTRRQNLLSTGEAATNLETAGRNEYNTNQATALSLLGLLSDLEGNRFNQSLALTGQSSATQSSLSSTLSGLISNLQNQGYLSSQQAAQLWSQVGSSLGNVVNSYPTGTNTTSTPPSGFTNGGAFNLPTQFQALYLD